MAYLLLEDGSKLLLEDQSGSLLLEGDNDGPPPPTRNEPVASLAAWRRNGPDPQRSLAWRRRSG